MPHISDDNETTSVFRAIDNRTGFPRGCGVERRLIWELASTVLAVMRDLGEVDRRAGGQVLRQLQAGRRAV